MTRFVRYASTIVLLAGAAASAHAGAVGNEVGFPQFPSVSPDGSRIVFSWGGDLWITRAEGGAATRLTSHPAEEGRAEFSNDGKTLVFESNRAGGQNLFSMPLIDRDGVVLAGPITALTHRDRPAALSGFSRDGRHVLFHGFLDDSTYRMPNLYQVPIEGGPITMISPAHGRGPRMAHDGDILFTRGYWNWERPDYRGSGAMDIHRHDAQTGEFRRITFFDGNDGEAFGLPDGSTVFISSRDGENNLYRLEAGKTDRDRAALTQLTFFNDRGVASIGHGVRDLDVSQDGSTAVFCVWDTIYTLDLTTPNAKPVAVEVMASADSDSLDTRRIDLSGRVSETALHPSGDAVVVQSRGELFMRPTADDRPTRRITSTPAREQFLAWSPDGRAIYFSTDASGVWEIHEATVSLTRSDIAPKDEKPAEEEPKQAEQPAAQEPAAEQPSEQPATFDDGVSGFYACQAIGVPQTPGPIPFSMKLDITDGAVAGSLDVPALFEASITGGTYDAATGKLTFSVDVQGLVVTFDGSLIGGEFKGTVTGDGINVQVTGNRVTPILRKARPAAASAATPGEPAADASDAKKDEKKDEKPKIDYAKRWAEALRFETRPVVQLDGHNAYLPMPSPDGRKLLYIRDRGDLVLRDLASGEDRVVFEAWSTPDVQWASDSRHIVYDSSDLDFNSDVFILDALDPDAKPVNITRHPDIDTNPHLSADGKLLVFSSDRAGENWDFDAYGVYLDKSLESLPAYELKERFENAAKEARKRKMIDPVDLTKAPEKEPEALEFPDLEDAYLRVFRLTSNDSVRDLAILPGGDRVIFEGTVDGSSGLYSIDYRGGDRKRLTGSVSDMRVMPDGGTISYVSGGAARTIGSGGGSAKSFPISADDIVIDVAAEQRQKFIEAARNMGQDFYHPTLKGLDWEALTQRYLSLAEQTRTSSEFNRVFSLMLGELDGSHLGIFGGEAWGTASPANGYLGVDVVPVEGGFKVTAVLPGSPAAAQRTRIEVGEVITAIEGERLAEDGSMPTGDFVAHMAGTIGDELLIAVRDAEGEERQMLITPIGWGSINNLEYDAMVAERRRLVHEWSGGQLGYLHIRGMSQPSVRDFERDLFAAASGRRGLVIDVRDNGGGSTTDILLSSLTAPAHSYTVPRGADQAKAAPDAYPRDRRLIYQYQRPISVLINQHSFSNAEIFAHAIKTIGRGKLVGTPTFGGVISTGAFSLIDGTTVRRPFRGWYLPDGTDMENNGAYPDIPVARTPATEAAGEDAQLRAAVLELLERVESAPDGLWAGARGANIPSHRAPQSASRGGGAATQSGEASGDQ